MSEALELRTEAYRAEAKKLLAADRRIVLAMRRELRVIAKPAGDRTINALAAAMPHRGGLSARIAARGRVSLLVDLKRGVKVQLANKDGMFMDQFERGQIRHRVYGRWLPGQRPQTVPSGKAGEHFETEAPKLAENVSRVVERTARSAL